MRATILQSVFPQDTNSLGTLFAGTLVGWMDKAAAYAAMRRVGGPVVTRAMEEIGFRIPLRLGELVEVDAQVISAGTTSMRVRVDVWREDLAATERELCVQGHFTMVAVGADGRPVPVPAESPDLGG
ncbi:MAG: acyl-CoA thioesterase [Actinobacteria bacterium]|nr:acyl-CoA thioesterase [Thermoleophilia bacterium]MCB9011203.1 acyl-CoA thioesterase [Actinomycetota bacterium]